MLMPFASGGDIYRKRNGGYNTPLKKQGFPFHGHRRPRLYRIMTMPHLG